MNKIEKYIDSSVREALKNFNSGIVILRLDELELLIDKIVSKTLQRNSYPASIVSEFGGISLAEEITGYKKQSIYQMVSCRQIPFIKKQGKLFFSRQDLLKWLQEGHKGTISELSKDTHLGKM
jgi:hypothetical protein